MSVKEKERELIISFREKGKTVREIADLLEVSKSKAGFWAKHIFMQNFMHYLCR